MIRWICAGLTSLLLFAGALDAQTLRISGGEGLTAAGILRDIAADDNYIIVSRDTVLPEEFRATGDLIVWDADVRLEGTVDGRVAIVDGVLFVRPGAVIRGDVAVIGGEYYPSGLAELTDPTVLPLSVDTRSALSGDTLTVRLIPPPKRSSVGLSGLGGFHIPTYDRVDGLSVRLGVEGGWPAAEPNRRASVWGVYHSARGDFDGGVTAEFRTARNYWLRAEASSATLTNDAWIKGDLINSLRAIAFRSDLRNYYHSDALSLTLARRLDEPLIPGEHFIGPRVRLLYSKDSSLEASSPWTILSRDEAWSPNPAIADGTLVSVAVGSELNWIGQGASFVGDISLEWAPPGLSDFEFARWLADGSWSMLALWGHTISVHGRGSAPVGESAAPPQRWSTIGGSSTLSTFEFGDFRGDHLAFFESVYAAPLPWARLPLVGIPSLEFRHAVGMAWSGDNSPPWEQNLGIRLRVSIFDATLYMDPGAEGFSSELSFGTSF